MNTPHHDGDPERDAWLSEALRHAPDAQAAPPSTLSDAILRQARAAARSESAPASAKPARGRVATLWAWLARPPVAAGFASVMVATVVGLMWWDRPIDETLIRPPAADATPPAAAMRAPAPEAAPASAVAESPRPTEPPEQTADQLTRTAPARAPAAGAQESARARVRAAPKVQQAPAEVEPAPVPFRNERPMLDAAPTPATPPLPTGEGAQAPATAPAPAAAATPAPAPIAPTSAMAPAPAPTQALRSRASPALSSDEANASASNAASRSAAKAAASTVPLSRWVASINEQPERWSWRRGSGVQPMSLALQRWLAQLDQATAARWRNAADAPPSDESTLQLYRDGAPTLTILFADDAVWLAPGSQANLPRATIAALKQALNDATR